MYLVTQVFEGIKSSEEGKTINAEELIKKIEQSAVKVSVIQMINRMPDTTTLEDIIAELYFKQKVDAGLQALKWLK